MRIPDWVIDPAITGNSRPVDGHEANPRLDQPSHTRLLAIGGRPPDLITPPTGCSFAPRCPYAGDKCLTEIPELEAASADHFFACWHPVGSPRWRSKQDELVSTGVLSVTGGIA